MASTLTPSEEAQLGQTIEMFEVITQSQPQDYQSLEILKEAYSKLNRESDVINTSKRIAQAYVQMGQLSSAILEYETILQRFPDDPDVQAALQQIETKANNFPMEPLPAEPAPQAKAQPSPGGRTNKVAARDPQAEIDDGRRRICIVLDVPTLNARPPHALAMARRRSMDTGFIGVTRNEILRQYREVEDELRAAEKHKNFIVVDPKDILCRSGSCTFEADGKSLYFDDNHLSMTGARFVAPVLERCFDASSSDAAR